MKLDLLTRNWELKLLALLVAFALWVFVVSSDRAELAMAATLEYVGLGDRVLVGDPPQTVDVHVEVARWALDRLRAETLRVPVDVAQLAEGEAIVTLSPKQVQAPPGVTVLWVAPGRLRLFVERAVERRLPVAPQVRGVPAAGYSVERVGVEPPAVQVKGARSTIEAREMVETVPVDVSGRREPLTQAVDLVLPDRLYATQDRTVQVTVDIQPDTGVRDGKESPK